MLNGKEHFAPETLFEVLRALSVELELVDRDEVYEHASWAFEPEAVRALLERRRSADCG